jgi:hypothetical protein
MNCLQEEGPLLPKQFRPYRGVSNCLGARLSRWRAPTAIDPVDLKVLRLSSCHALAPVSCNQRTARDESRTVLLPAHSVGPLILSSVEAVALDIDSACGIECNLRASPRLNWQV